MTQISIYNDADTLVHHLNPAMKIGALILLFVWAGLLTHPAFCLIPLLFVAIVTVISRAMKNVLRIWFFLAAILFFSVVVWGGFTKGDHLWLQFGPVAYSRESVFYGLGLGIRLIAMLVGGVVFLSTTRVEEFSDGLRALSVPYPIAFALTFAFRLVPDFLGTAVTIAQAQQLRGLDLESGGPVTRIRKYSPLLVPVFVTAIRKTDLLAMALEARGFSPTRVRTQYASYPMTTGQYVVLGFLVAVCALTWGLRSVGVGLVPLGH